MCRLEIGARDDGSGSPCRCSPQRTTRTRPRRLRRPLNHIKPLAERRSAHRQSPTVATSVRPRAPSLDPRHPPTTASEPFSAAPPLRPTQPVRPAPLLDQNLTNRRRHWLRQREPSISRNFYGPNWASFEPAGALERTPGDALGLLPGSRGSSDPARSRRVPSRVCPFVKREDPRTSERLLSLSLSLSRVGLLVFGLLGNEGDSP